MMMVITLCQARVPQLFSKEIQSNCSMQSVLCCTCRNAWICPFSCPETRVLHFGSNVQCWRKEREYETQEIDSKMGTLHASSACTVRNHRGPGL